MSLSRAVDSNQEDLHPRLQAVVGRHLERPFLRPIARHNQRAFDTVANQVAAYRGPLLLDSFCGVGASTLNLARQYPDALVIGVDKSAHRLARHQPEPGVDNYRLVRADVDDFWRLALAAGWHPDAHYLLYPNPWPKSGQLQRRVHGSPLFPTLLDLGGRLELRSNWLLYLREFNAALAQAGHRAQLETLPPGPAMTPFEHKYRLAGQALWRLHCTLHSPEDTGAGMTGRTA